MSEALRLTRIQFEAVLEHANLHKPEEACGILAGDADGTVRRIFPMINSEHSSTFYMMDSSEQFQVFDQMETEGLELVAIFHSHPHSAAFPSARDCELAFYPDSLYMIVSLMNDEPEGRVFKIVDGKFEEAPLIVNDSAEA